MENPNYSEKSSFRIGIIVNQTNLEDILYYNKELQTINKLYGDKVSIVLLGYKPEDDKLNALDNVEFEYYKPVSIIHYFKYLKDANIDLLFIPLIHNIYNATSENYKKYLEAGIHYIPVIVPNIYPYSTVIRDKQNGFIYGTPENCGREHFIPYLKDLLLNIYETDLVNKCGQEAYVDVTTKFDFSKENIEVISKLF
jgi:glycosyltransferase involved in cell wall biosynthesis